MVVFPLTVITSALPPFQYRDAGSPVSSSGVTIFPQHAHGQVRKTLNVIEGRRRRAVDQPVFLFGADFFAAQSPAGVAQPAHALHHAIR